jgi:sepiapterin reductase
MSTESNALAIVITGASRGFGRALAIVAKDSFQGTAKLILVARSLEGLENTLAALPRHQNSCCHSMDLGNLAELDSNIDIILKDLEESSKIILFQNAGTIGHLGLCSDYPNLEDMRANVDLNITSCLWLSSRLTQYARSSRKDVVIVNISSLVAIADFPTLGIYSAGKAARDKYHSLIAKEEANSNSNDRVTVRSLNYAPVS